MKISGLLLSSVVSSLTAFSKASVRGSVNEDRELVETYRPFEECMHDISEHTTWPMPASPRSTGDDDEGGRIDSTFGPVHSLCLDEDIFHHGISVFGHPEDPVLAPYTGIVTFIANGDRGYCVFIEHRFQNDEKCEFHEEPVETWYSVFMGMGPETEGLVNIEDEVLRGQQIGTVGHHACKNGDYPRNTVEYQIRIGSRHSLTQAEKLGMAQSYDPSVHPLYAHENLDTTHVVTKDDVITEDGEVLIVVKAEDEEPNIDRYVINCEGSGEHILDLSLREGYDAGDPLAFDKTVPYLDAQPFGHMRAKWTGHLLIPESWLDEEDQDCTVTVTDVWGEVQELTFTYPDDFTEA